MSSGRLIALTPLIGALAASITVSSPVTAADLNFDFKINQGAVGTTFATLSLDELTPGTTTFTLNTSLSGGPGNPGIAELMFGCSGCGSPTIIPGLGVSIEPGGTQADYTFDHRVRFDPRAVQANTPLTWTATSAPGAFLESTSGAGPNSFALIQLTGGTEVINGENVTSGFYVAVVPEPSTYALTLTGLGVIGLWARRRNRQD